jgi:hypothetical protein
MLLARLPRTFWRIQAGSCQRLGITLTPPDPRTAMERSRAVRLRALHPGGGDGAAVEGINCLGTHDFVRMNPDVR